MAARIGQSISNLVKRIPFLGWSFLPFFGHNGHMCNWCKRILHINECRDSSFVLHFLIPEERVLTFVWKIESIYYAWLISWHAECSKWYSRKLSEQLPYPRVRFAVHLWAESWSTYNFSVTKFVFYYTRYEQGIIITIAIQLINNLYTQCKWDSPHSPLPLLCVGVV